MAEVTIKLTYVPAQSPHIYHDEKDNQEYMNKVAQEIAGSFLRPWDDGFYCPCIKAEIVWPTP